MKDTETDVTYAAGTIVGANGLRVSGRRSVGDLSGSAMPFFKVNVATIIV